ncbi:MAG: pyridoxamine 5'-phosphate oxidase family protein [Bacteroidota bacterium]
MYKQDLWQQGWQLLIRAQHDKKHAFRTPTLSTVSKEHFPQARKVVLRAVDAEKRTLRFYTDYRSQKILDLRHQPIAHWLFWDPKSRLQISAMGSVSFLPQQQVAFLFTGLPKHGRKSYATLNAPGTSLDKSEDGLPEDWDHLSLVDTNYALANFCVGETIVEKAEILYLNREGHRRLRANRLANNDWQLDWLVP